MYEFTILLTEEHAATVNPYLRSLGYADGFWVVECTFCANVNVAGNVDELCYCCWDTFSPLVTNGSQLATNFV